MAKVSSSNAISSYGSFSSDATTKNDQFLERHFLECYFQQWPFPRKTFPRMPLPRMQAKKIEISKSKERVFIY